MSQPSQSDSDPDLYESRLLWKAVLHLHRGLRTVCIVLTVVGSMAGLALYLELVR